MHMALAYHRANVKLHAGISRNSHAHTQTHNPEWFRAKWNGLYDAIQLLIIHQTYANSTDSLADDAFSIHSDCGQPYVSVSWISVFVFISAHEMQMYFFDYAGVGKLSGSILH